MASLLTFSLLTLSLLLPHSTTSISDTTITNAAEILSDAGFTAMSLTLPLISFNLLSPLPSATLFAPPDTAFSSSLSLSSGQPSFSLLQFHFSPRLYSSPDLQSLTFGSQIPTLLPNHSLIVTASVFDQETSVNGVKIDTAPVFNDGFLVVYGIERFLNPNFRFEFDGAGVATDSAFTPISSPIHRGCASGGGGGYGGASAAMRSRGYSTMAAFLDLQLSRFGNRITVFAPSDAAMEENLRNYTDWQWSSESVSLFLRHVVPCELTWADLVGLDEDAADGANVLRTFLDGFVINVTHSGDTLMLNGEASVDFPDFYGGDRVLVHGLSRVLAVPRKSDDERAGGGGDGGDAYSPASDWMYHGEF